MTMSLKILDIIVKKIIFGEEKIGLLILNGVSGTTLKKFKIDAPYDRMVTRSNLLNEGTDYSSFGYDEYLSMVRNGLKKDIRKNVLIRERNLPIETRNKLIKHYTI